LDTILKICLGSQTFYQLTSCTNLYKLLLEAHKIYYSGSFSTHSHYTTRHQLQSPPVPFFSSFSVQHTSNFVISALWNKLTKFLKIIQPFGKFKTELRHHLHSVELSVVPCMVMPTFGPHTTSHANSHWACHHFRQLYYFVCY